MRSGGVGAAVAQALHEAGVLTPACAPGVADGFPRQTSRAEILAEAGLTSQAIAQTSLRPFRGLSSPRCPPAPTQSMRSKAMKCALN